MILHTVAPGQSIFSIAARYGVGTARILEENGLTESEVLVPGQVLIISVPERYYTVEENSTPSEVAEAAGISLSELYRNNPSYIGRNIIYAGETAVLSYLGEQSYGGIANGYAYPFISEETLAYALPFLTDLTIFTYGFTEDGRLVYPESNDQSAINAARDMGVAPIMLLSTLSEDGSFDNRLSSALFADRATEDRLIGEVLRVMKEKEYRGLDIDFEYIEPSERSQYSAFIARTKARMQEYGYTLTVAVAPKTSDDQSGLLYEAHDYRALGEAADHLTLMTYEWGYSYGPPQAVAPLDKVQEVLRYALSRVPSKKLILGIPTYGYDWTLPYTEGTAAHSLSTKEAVDLARRYGASISYDPIAASPFFLYVDNERREHIVWFEDALSYRAKLDLVQESGIAGYSVWTIMKEPKEFFAVSRSV